MIPPESPRNLGKEISGATLGKKHKHFSPGTPELMSVVPHSHYPTRSGQGWTWPEVSQGEESIGVGRTLSSELKITLECDWNEMSFWLILVWNEKKKIIFWRFWKNQPCVGKLEFPLGVSFQGLGIAKAQLKLSLRQTGTVPPKGWHGLLRLLPKCLRSLGKWKNKAECELGLLYWGCFTRKTQEKVIKSNFPSLTWSFVIN